MSNFSLNDNLIVPEEYEVFLRNLRNEFKKGIINRHPMSGVTPALDKKKSR